MTSFILGVLHGILQVYGAAGLKCQNAQLVVVRVCPHAAGSARVYPRGNHSLYHVTGRQRK